MQEICRTGSAHMIAFQDHLNQAARTAWHGTRELPDKITGILEQAEGKPLADCREAINRLKATNQYFPKPAEFNNALPKKAGNDNGVEEGQKQLFEKVLARKRDLMVQHSKALNDYLGSFKDYSQAIKASQDIGRAVNDLSYRSQSRHFQEWEASGGVVVSEAIDREFPGRPWAKQNRRKS